MKKALDLGKIITKEEQRRIFGGYGGNCVAACYPGGLGNPTCYYSLSLDDAKLIASGCSGNFICDGWAGTIGC